LGLVAIMVSFMIPGIGTILAIAILILTLVAALAVAARRLHDRNKSAWWLLIMYVPLILLSAFSQIASMSSPEAGAGFGVLSLPFSIWILVELGCLRGTVGSNRFGPDPLQPATAEVFT
jgi:uncharacterized membrane protein YhaH (DUF805 family)